MADKTKRVWLIRHAKQISTEDSDDSWQISAKLAPEATKRIKEAANYFKWLGVCFKLFRHSSLVRAQQTCEFLREFMGSDAPIAADKKLGPGEINEWNTKFNVWKKQNPGWKKVSWGPTEWAKLWPSLCEAEGERVLIAVERIARKLKDGENAAAISHNPLIRLAEGQATGMVSNPDLQHCQSICFTFRNEELVGCEAHLF
jgi:broad specificity phosphatase PhoE